MLARVSAPALSGIDGRLVSIECDITSGLPGIVIVGLGDKAVDEARERVRSAIKNSGLLIAPKRITLSLAPADLPKDGSGYDLGIAMAILAATNQVDSSALEDSIFHGELSLDGAIRAVKGSVVAAQLANDLGISRLFVAVENADEASLFAGTKVFPVSSLQELFRHINGIHVLSPHRPPPTNALPSPTAVDLSSIYGQAQAKRAIEIAAAGGHNIILSGPPGAGKTLLARSLMGLLPKPTPEEVLQITKIQSLSGIKISGIAQHRPFRSPHHTASSVSLIGGGTRPRPGEISLSHGGVLFLDEMPEFPRSVLEVLRQPLEDGSITIARAAGVVTYPARFMLVGTANPCPCGYFGKGLGCECKPGIINAYRRKISGPLLDRIDMLVDVPNVEEKALLSAISGEPTSDVAARVESARNLQTQRLVASDASCNANMTNEDLKNYCRIDNETSDMASIAMSDLHLSARGYNRTLKVARTIADLEGAPDITLPHFAEALQYRPRVNSVQARKPKPLRVNKVIQSRSQTSMA